MNLIFLLCNCEMFHQMRKNYTSKIIAALCFFLSIQQSSAQEIYNPTIVNPLSQSWRWKQFPELEGQGIRDIYEGKNKSLWVAFNEGVYEYDGYNWQVHNKDNGFISSPIEQVLLDNEGIAYAASSAGIHKYDGNSWTQIFKTPENLSFSFNNLKLLEGNIIVATSNRGILILENKIRLITSEEKYSSVRNSFQNLDIQIFPHEFLPNEDFLDVSDIIQDQNGKIWVGCTLNNEQGRILQFDKKYILGGKIEKYEIIASNENITLGESQKFLEAHNGSIWVVNSTYKSGISIFKDNKWSYIKLNDFFGGDEYMTDIVQSIDGTIWIGSLGRLFTFKDEKWSVYLPPLHPIPANQIMLHNSSGNFMWVAGNKSKVYYLDFSTDKWISYSNLYFQFQNEIGNNWFLDIDGKVVFEDGGKWFSFGPEDGLMDAPVRIIQTKNGEIWAAGSHKGIAATAVLKNNKWFKTDHPNLSWGIDYRSVFEDKNGDLWFGAAVDAEIDKGQLSGVLRYTNSSKQSKKWIHYPASDNGLNQTNVYGVGESVDGRIWIGGGSLYSFNGIEWLQPLDQRLQQFVNVAYSQNGVFYAGSRYYGIFTFDGEKWNHYDKLSGLAGNTIISIDAIDKSSVYVATDNDICHFNGESWVKNIFPKELNLELEGGQLLHDRNGALWINKSDREWKRRAFTHSNTKMERISEFVAHRYKPDLWAPETEVSMLTVEVSHEGNTVVKWIGKDYFGQTSADDLMYSYRIDGGEWSPYMYEDHYTFVSLKHGKHFLEVRSRDLDLNVDRTPAFIEFKVLPPIWKQTWFILLMLAFAITLAIYEYRIISKKKKLEVLNKSLHFVNEKLKDKSEKIKIQNDEILLQQKHNLSQSRDLEIINKNLEERNVQIENQKEKLEELVIEIEELSKAKIGFFTNISHELRTPLTLINGPILQLIDHAQNLSASQQEKLYHVIHRNSERLLKLINQLLEMRKIENSNLEINRKSIDLPHFLEVIVSLYENLAIERNIKLGYHINLKERNFDVDSDKLEKVLVNLLSNAFKHTPDGGTILIILQKSNPPKINSAIAYEAYFEIKVQDSGHGISKIDLEHIYERFFTKSNQNLESSGTGIGLAYSKILIEVMEGSIFVESKLNEGTIFSIYLPIIHESTNSELSSYAGHNFSAARKDVEILLNTFIIENEIHDTLDELEVEGRKKILIVEDHSDMLLYLESLLENDYTILKANNGQEGLRKSLKYSVDLIISDVMMPIMGGLEFCNKIKSNLSTSHIPVILLTAKVLEENQIEGFEIGADEYITKPFNPQLLIARIANILELRENLKESFLRDFMLSPQKIKLTSPDEELLKKSISIMEENMENSDFNVNQMCKMVHLSHMHFIRKIKQLTGKKPVDLLKSYRLKRAKDLLSQNDVNISDIAYKVGYDLPNSFSRAFKKEFGMSPKEFKESNLVDLSNIESN